MSVPEELSVIPAADTAGGALQVLSGLGMPNGPSTYGALYALPMANVTAGATPTAITTYRPGTGGLPSAGLRFGWTAR